MGYGLITTRRHREGAAEPALSAVEGLPWRSGGYHWLRDCFGLAPSQ